MVLLLKGKELKGSGITASNFKIREKKMRKNAQFKEAGDNCGGGCGVGKRNKAGKAREPILLNKSPKQKTWGVCEKK